MKERGYATGGESRGISSFKQCGLKCETEFIQNTWRIFGMYSDGYSFQTAEKIRNVRVENFGERY